MLINSPNISGSLTVTGNSVITGSLTVLGGINGAITGSATSASYVEYSNVANKPTLVSGSSQVTYSGLTGIPSGIVSGSSQVTYSGLTGIPSGIVSGSSQVTYSGLTGIPSGIVSGSAQVAGFGIFATTGSNQFNGSQTITGSLTVTGQVVAQTLNVQQVTSSIVYSSGSNIFGNSLGNTQQFTGSLQVTGSSHYLLGNVGVGTTSPLSRFHVNTGTNQNFRVRPGTDVGATNGVALNSRTDDDGSLQQLTLRASDVVMLTSGNVGIGTASPGSILQANFSNATTYSSGVTGNGLTLYNTSATNNQYVGLYFLGEPSSGNAGQATIYGITTGTGAMDLAFSTRGSSVLAERMRITSGGNVGIGTSNPVQKLHVEGSATIGTTGTEDILLLGRALSGGVSFQQAASLKLGRYQNAGGAFESYTRLDIALRDNSAASNYNTNTTVMTLTNAGNVGIGTTDPQSSLHIYTTNATAIIQNSSTSAVGNTSRLFFRSLLASGNTGFVGFMDGVLDSTTQNTGYLKFHTYNNGAGDERMRITSDNNVLFNTTSSGTTNTSSFIFRSGTGAYSGVMVINHATTNNTGAGFIDCYYNTGYIGGIQQNGTSNVSFTTSSDYRLKQDLKDFNGLNLITNLKVYDFKWKAEDSRMHGVIAHELQEVIPYAVHGNKDETKENGKIKVQVVDYSKLVPVLIKSIQELKAENDTLKSRIDTLEQA